MFKMARPNFNDRDPKKTAEVKGFIHDVSDVKRSRSNTKYFNGTMQVKDDLWRMVCFSPEKHSIYQNAEKLKSPVKLENAAIVPSKFDPGKVEIHVNRRTNLEVIKPSAVSFKRRRLDFRDHQIPVMKIDNLKESRQKVTVNARVLEILEEPESIELYGKPTMKQLIIVADDTCAMEITLWGELITKVKKNEDYCFQNIQTRVFFDTVKLTTTPNTKIISIPALESIVSHENFSGSEVNESVTGTIKHIKVNKTVKCSSCSKIVTDAENKTSLITKCTTCGMTQKTRDLKMCISIQANVQSDETQQIERLTIFENVLTHFLNKHDKTDLIQSPTDLEEYLLLLTTCVYTHRKQIIKNIELL